MLHARSGNQVAKRSDRVRQVSRERVSCRELLSAVSYCKMASIVTVTGEAVQLGVGTLVKLGRAESIRGNGECPFAPAGDVTPTSLGISRSSGVYIVEQTIL
jgi:hypothetical protein